MPILFADDRVRKTVTGDPKSFLVIDDEGSGVADRASMQFIRALFGMEKNSGQANAKLLQGNMEFCADSSCYGRSWLDVGRCGFISIKKALKLQQGDQLDTWTRPKYIPFQDFGTIFIVRSSLSEMSGLGEYNRLKQVFSEELGITDFENKVCLVYLLGELASYDYPIRQLAVDCSSEKDNPLPAFVCGHADELVDSSNDHIRLQLLKFITCIPVKPVQAPEQPLSASK